MKKTNKRLAALISAVLLGLVVAGCAGGADGDEDWPNSDVRMIIPSSPGGGFDTAGRYIQPYLEEELGVSVPVENQEGGNFAIGSNTVANAGPDCEDMLVVGIPHLLFGYLTQEVEYTYEDFHPIGNIAVEPGIIRVGNDAPWDSVEELVDDARERPGEIRASVSGLTASNYIGLIQLQDATDTEFNIVPYDGGSPARTAVVSGEVEFTHAGVFNSRGIQDDSRVLAVHQDENEWPDLTDDAPTLNEALDISLDPNASTYGSFVNQECVSENPERHERLVEALEAATQNEDFLAELEEAGEEDHLQYLGPEEYDEQVQEELESIESLVEERPELFEGGA